MWNKRVGDQGKEKRSRTVGEVREPGGRREMKSKGRE